VLYFDDIGMSYLLWTTIWAVNVDWLISSWHNDIYQNDIVQNDIVQNDT